MNDFSLFSTRHCAREGSVLKFKFRFLKDDSWFRPSVFHIVPVAWGLAKVGESNHTSILIKNWVYVSELLISGLRSSMEKWIFNIGKLMSKSILHFLPIFWHNWWFLKVEPAKSSDTESVIHTSRHALLFAIYLAK